MKRYLLSILASLFIGTGAFAAQIQYIQTGVGSGTFAGTAFGNRAPLAFTIRATGETANIQSCAIGCYFIDNLSASIEIATIGTFQFMSPTRYFSNGPIIGFSRAALGGVDLYNLRVGNGWDMTTLFGPVSGDGGISQWAISTVTTTGGVLLLDDVDSLQGTFQAIVGNTSVVPIPGSLLLLGSSLAGLLAVVRRRKSAVV